MRNPFRPQRKPFCRKCGGAMAWMELVHYTFRHDPDTGESIVHRWSSWACTNAFDSDGAAWVSADEHDGIRLYTSAGHPAQTEQANR